MRLPERLNPFSLLLERIGCAREEKKFFSFAALVASIDFVVLFICRREFWPAILAVVALVPLHVRLIKLSCGRFMCDNCERVKPVAEKSEPFSESDRIICKACEPRVEIFHLAHQRTIGLTIERRSRIEQGRGER